MRIFLDTNVLLDFLTRRQPYFDDAEKIFKICKTDEIKGYIAAHSVMNIFYILRKIYTPDERKEMLLYICNLFEIVEIDKYKIINALYNNDFSDMEDCLQNECAIAAVTDYIITRNIKDFSYSNIRVTEPHEFLNIYEKE